MSREQIIIQVIEVFEIRVRLEYFKADNKNLIGYKVL